MCERLLFHGPCFSVLFSYVFSFLSYGGMDPALRSSSIVGSGLVRVSELKFYFRKKKADRRLQIDHD